MKYKRKIIYSLMLSSFTSISYAQSPVRGNPVDTLPRVNINKNQKPDINIQQQTSPVEATKKSSIMINEFKIQGVSALDFKKVAGIFQPITNKQITVEELIAKATEVTELYKKEGYILSFAYLPQQNFSNGVAHVVIVEGYVKDIKITGKTANNENRIKQILLPLTNDKPLTQKTFERVSNVLALQPGIKVNLNIAPPTTAGGATTVVADIVQKKADLTLGIEAGNPDFQAIIAATINSLTPLGDQLTVSTLQPQGSKDIQFYGLNYIVPLGSDGLIGKINATTYTEHPKEGSLNDFGYEDRYKNKSQRLGFSLNYPIILENKQNWFVGGGFYVNKEQQTYYPIRNDLFPDLDIKTRLSVLYLETSYAQADEDQSRQIGFSIHKGMNILGAYQKNNIHDTSFIKFKLSANQNFNLPNNFGLRFAGVYQYSPDNLANSEQISFGGRYFGAAYEPGEIAGDKGWGLSSELNYSFKPNYKYVKLIQPYMAVDTSKVSFNNLSISNSHISSATMGVRMNNETYYSLNLSVSKPIAHKPIDNESLRYYLSYTYQF